MAEDAGVEAAHLSLSEDTGEIGATVGRLRRADLLDAHLAEVHALARGLGVPGYRRLRRVALVEAILAADGSRAVGSRTRDHLERRNLSELHALASRHEVARYRLLRREALIDALAACSESVEEGVG